MGSKELQKSIRARYYRGILKRYPRRDDTVPPEEHLGVLQALWWHRRYAQAFRFCRDVCIPSLEEAGETDDLSQFWSYLGWTAMKLRRFDEAETTYRKAMRLASWDWEPRLGLGTVALQRRNIRDANRFLKEAFSRDCILLPSAAAEAHEALKKKRMKRFRDCYLQARNAMDHLEEVIKYRIRGKEVPESEDFLRKAMRACPDDPNILALAGYVLLELGEREKARKHLASALRLAPHHPWAHGAMALLAVQEKRWPAAYAHVSSAVVAAEWTKVHKEHDDFRIFMSYAQYSPGYFAQDLLEVLFSLQSRGWRIEGIEEFSNVKDLKGYDQFRMVRNMLLKQKVKPY